MNAIAEMCAKRIKDIALDLERTGRLATLLTYTKHTNNQERTDMVAANRGLQISLEESLHELASMVRTDFGDSQDKSRKDFEQWYATHAFDYVRDPIGSRECGLQWKAWQASRGFI